MRTLLVSEMCFNESSYDNSFTYENSVLDKLYDEWRNTKESKYGVLIGYYAAALLRPSFDGPARLTGRTVTLLHGDHVFDENLLAVRRKAIERLVEIRENEKYRVLCDAVIANMQGVNRGEPGKLWKATLTLAYELYIAKIETIDDANIPRFIRLETALEKANLIENEKLGFLHGDPVTHAICCIFSTKPYSDQDDLKLVKSLRNFEADQMFEALRKVCLISKLSNNTLPITGLGASLKTFYHQNNEGALQAVEGIMLSDVPAYVIPDEMMAGWIEKYGAQEVREIVRGIPEDEWCQWLRAIDTTRIKSGVDENLVQDILLGATTVGETISFSDAMTVDKCFPGFYSDYATIVLEKLNKGSYRLYNLIPNDMKDKAQHEFISRPRNYLKVKHALFAQVCEQDSYWDKHLISHMIDINKKFASEATPILVSANASSTFSDLGEVIWDREDGKEIADAVWSALNDCEMQFPSTMLPMWLDSFTKSSFESHGEAIMEWLLLHSVVDGKLVVSVADVAMELPFELRVKYVVNLCAKGLAGEELEKMPFLYSNLTVSWSGSAVPLLKRKVEFIDEVIGLLSGVKFLKHRLVLNKTKSAIEKYMEQVEVNEFIYPF